MRPKIICHMISSIDGRLLVDRWSKPSSAVKQSVLMRHYENVSERYHANGWMVGRKTMQEVLGSSGKSRSFKPGKTGKSDLRSAFVGKLKGRNVAVVVDPHGKLHYNKDHVGGDHVVSILSEKVSNKYLAELQKVGVSYLFAGRNGDDLHKAMDTLGETFGIQTLLLEGGGRINGSFLKKKLIDEISLLVYPGIDGLAGVPSIFDFQGRKNEKPAGNQSLRLTASETLDGGMIWLHYKVERIR